MLSIRKITLAVCAAVTLGSGAATAATYAINDRIYSQDICGWPFGCFSIGSSIQRHNITATNQGRYSFDVLSNRVLNGGRSSLNSSMYLFENVGGVAGNLIGSNRDGGVAGFGDGSVSAVDSFMQLVLDAGNYILAIGHRIDEAEARSGFISFNDIDRDSSYQITVTSPVPLPAGLPLLAAGLGGLGLLRRRKRTLARRAPVANR